MPKHFVGLTDREKLLWVVGFLEGEGCFDRQTSGTPRIRATQKQRQPLTRLRYLVGGAMHQDSRGHWNWSLNGILAQGLMLAIRKHMSPWRAKQIGAALY